MSENVTPENQESDLQVDTTLVIKEETTNYKRAGWFFISFSVGTMVLFLIDFH